MQSSASAVNWPPAPAIPAGYPWPAAPPMSAMPPIGMRPPMMFGPPPAGFPPGTFHQPLRLPFNAVPEQASEESKEAGAVGEIDKPEGSGGGGDSCAEEGLHTDGENMPDATPMGNFPRPMGGGDWRMRGPVPFMHGPNMPRPDVMRGPPSLLGECPAPRGLRLPPPARFSMPQNFPNVEEEEGEEYGDEYEEEGGNEEEQYDEECEEFPFDGNDHMSSLFAVVTCIHYDK